MGMGKGVGDVMFFNNLVAHFDTSFLNTLVLTIIRATDAVSFIHSSLMNPRGLVLITILLAYDQTL